MTRLRFFKRPFNTLGFLNGTSVPLPTSSNSCSKHSLRTAGVILDNSSEAYLTILASLASASAAQLLFIVFIAHCISSKLIDMMRGLLSPLNGNSPRMVLPQK